MIILAAIWAYRRRNSKTEEWKGLLEELSDLKEQAWQGCSEAKVAMNLETEQDEQPHLGSPLTLDTVNTFRDDVRTEWIHALLGNEFPCPDHAPSGTTRILQGVGLAQVAPYTYYQVTIPPNTTQPMTSTPTSPLSPNANNEGVVESTPPGKLGISVSRLALGLYVRAVQPGSEAFCAGILPRSVLVSVNGMCLLAEPSKQALERLWQYEGRMHPTANTDKSTDNRNENSKRNKNGSQSSPPDSDGSIRSPLHMTLIHQGELYSVVLLSNPPYGIDWAPCGNFALVKRSYAHGEEAGVQVGSIIAKVQDKDIHELDHTVAAETLREAFWNQEPIQLTLCNPPPEARTGHFERLADAQSQNSGSTPKAKGQVADRVVTASRQKGGKPQRPQVVAQHEGVQVRVHPLLFSTKSATPATQPSTTTTGGHIVSSAVSLSQLAFRVSAGELFTFPRGLQYSSQRQYRPCPPLDVPLLELMRSDQCLRYILEYDHARYNENALSIQPVMKTNPNTPLELLQDRFSVKQMQQSLQTFLLPVLCYLSFSQATDEVAATSFRRFLLDIAANNVEFSHSMELIAQALHQDGLKMALAQQRRKRPSRLKLEVEALEQAPPKLLTPPRNVSSETPSPPTTAKTSENSCNLTVSTTTLTPPSSPNQKKSRKGLFRFLRKKNKKGKSNAKSPERSFDGPNNIEPQGDQVTEQARTTLEGRQTPAQTLATPNTGRVRSTSRTLQRRMSREPSPDVLFANTLLFIEELEAVCADIEKSLLRSISQKIAGWALQPWSASKETELAQVTHVMRERLGQCRTLPFLSPINAETLLSIDSNGCYILPSAHFPLLLTFDSQEPPERNTPTRHAPIGPERLYRVKVELIELHGTAAQQDTDRTFAVHGSVAGVITESGESIATRRGSRRHVWDQGDLLVFDSRTSWGPPQTLSLRISERSNRIVKSEESGKLHYEQEVGYCWVDLESLWQQGHADESNPQTLTCHAKVWSSSALSKFDEHGDLQEDGLPPTAESIELQLKVTTQAVPLSSAHRALWSRKRSLLYKHDDDVRQEMFAIEFVKSCDRILRSCGLDMRLLTFQCIPVGERRGFIEWVQGAVPLSEICQPFAGSILDRQKKESTPATLPEMDESEDASLSSVAKAGLAKYESLRRLNPTSNKKNKAMDGIPNNPIQDFLRAFAYDANDPYMVRKSVMETYVKSCAGYCVVTYILGVGDRHLDNLLLHPSGHFFHCDYSFILGNDPKKYLPLRITKDMVNGMGGPESDNFAMFLSLTCAAFLTLRRPENVRYLLSLVRTMEGCGLPDVEVTQSVEAAVMGVRDRLALDLTDDEAINFMEKLLEDSCSSRMWIAVDAIHSLGKRF